MARLFSITFILRVNCNEISPAHFDWPVSGFAFSLHLCLFPVLVLISKPQLVAQFIINMIVMNYITVIDWFLFWDFSMQKASAYTQNCISFRLQIIKTNGDCWGGERTFIVNECLGRRGLWKWCWWDFLWGNISRKFMKFTKKNTKKLQTALEYVKPLKAKKCFRNLKNLKRLNFKKSKISQNFKNQLWVYKSRKIIKKLSHTFFRPWTVFFAFC